MSLPKSPYECCEGFSNRYWTNGEEILCDHQDDCETIATFLEAIFGGNLVVQPGYYDPEEDNRDGLQDENTSYYYITID